MKHPHLAPCLALATAAVFFLGIGEGHAQTPTNSVQFQNGRLLAAACMQCHSSSGFDSITGESAREIISEMQEMKRGKKSPGIMEMIARGYTDSQIIDIATYLASLSKDSGGDDDDNDDDDESEEDDD
jgi:cytochrome c553